MHVSTPSRHPAHTRQRRTSDGVRAARPSRSPAPAPGVSCPLPGGPQRTVVIIGPAVEVIRRADRLCAYLLRGRPQGPAKVIQTRRGQRSGGFSFRPGGGPPLLGRFAAMCRPPSLFACRLRGGSVLHFLFPGVISPGFIFLSSCGFPVALRAVSVSLAWVYGVPRGPLWAVPVAVGLAYPAAGAPVWGLLGPSWGVPGPGMAGGGQSVFSVGRPIFCGGRPDRSARASGRVCLPAPKSLGAKSRPRQPFSRSAGLNYSRSSSADNSAIFLRIDSFFCAATKSLNSFAANSHL